MLGVLIPALVVAIVGLIIYLKKTNSKLFDYFKLNKNKNQFIDDGVQLDPRKSNYNTMKSSDALAEPDDNFNFEFT